MLSNNNTILYSFLWTNALFPFFKIHNIMNFCLVFSTLVSSAVAFSPSGHSTESRFSSAVHMSEQNYVYPTLNGWTADKNTFCAGLPGALAPMGNFDPAGFTKDLSVDEIKRYREAEVTHGRVSMLAVLGYLVGENFHPFFNGAVIGPANTHLAQVQEIAPFFFAFLTTAILSAELNRATTGWVQPDKAIQSNRDNDVDGAFGALLRKDYYPGDVGFDPLGLKPSDPTEYADMQTKELQHGRLAMLAAMGMIAQEQVTHDTLGATLKTFF